ncbi:uncharacterized protein C8A04DRAFT_37258 [Dichotomopilus funicola]|uniref:Uncharacterized protein n=1 Tax=Dichotomopilus funicola TaxID=1934379 RepID=A0AAN6V2I2_9PEZI|nr:hypothetical protein C8A04DRAFT_37258 [Dichotomopilus funicola]
MSFIEGTPERYQPNKTLLIREHRPPAPFGINGSYRDSPRPVVDWDSLPRYISRVEVALAYPPMENETQPTSYTTPAHERTLTITGSKTRRHKDATGRDRGGAHVLTCFLDGDPTVEYVAKIYDAADYPLSLQPIPGVGGVLAPAYFGSWTFALDVNSPDVNPDEDPEPDHPKLEPSRRWVRMILLELVAGECLVDMMEKAEVSSPTPERRYATTTDYSQLPPEDFRLLVMRNIIETDITIWWEGLLTHNDIEPHNIIVRPNGKVVIIDFNVAQLFNFTYYGDDHPRQLGPDDPYALTQPESPIMRYWPIPFGGAYTGWESSMWKHWVPTAWIEDPNRSTEWLVKTYRGDTRFAPLSQRWLNTFSHSQLDPRAVRLLESLGRKPAEEGE